MKNVLIVYHYIAHYRLPLYRILSRSDSPSYTFCSGTKSEISIKKADVKLAEMPVSEGGIKWILIKNWWLSKPFLIQFSVLKLSLSRKYDTIVYLGVMYYLSTWIGAILAKMTGKKVIFWTHGFLKEENNLKGFIRTLFYRLADEILVYGQRAKDILISKGFEASRIKLVYNSLDYDNQLHIKAKYQNDSITELFKNPNLPTIGFIGRITPTKKIGMLLEMLQQINKGDQKINLLIIGGGEQEKMLKKKAQELELEDYTLFYGPCYDEVMIYKLMQTMKVIVSPGEVGLTAIHALTYGIPVVTHNRFDKQGPEFEAIIPDKTGDFFEYEDLESMKNITLKWLLEKDKSLIEKDCNNVIDNYYNPYVQKKIFDSVV